MEHRASPTDGTGLGSFVIAIDGTAGSGKSSASRGVAQRLGLRYLDTGAMYRAMTWQMLLDGVDVFDPSAVATRAPTVAMQSGTDPRNPTIHLGNVSVAREIRSGEVNAAVSPVSAVPEVRALMVARQRQLIGAGGIVVEGRDIGTVVAPDAALKVYLTAHAAARAQRRSAEMAEATAVARHRHAAEVAEPADSADSSEVAEPRERDASTEQPDLADVEADLRRRDHYDSSRATAPLSAAADAVHLDTTELTLEQVIDTIVGLALERSSAGARG